ncbi:exo-alpha-sialidase [Spirosoma koreense]
MYANRRYLLFTPNQPIVLEQVVTINKLAPVGDIQFEPLHTDWRYCIEDNHGTLWGCLFSSLTTLCCAENSNLRPRPVYVFAEPIDSLFINRSGCLFVASGGVIYRSSTQGASFEAVLQLSSPISHFLYNNGMTELPDQALLLGEYGSVWENDHWQNMAFLYYSIDEGLSWTKNDFLQRNGVNKHIHVVRYSQLLRATLLTDGDNKKQLWVNSTTTRMAERASRKSDGWHLVNRFHYQMGGYISVAEADDMILLGSDYLGGTNFLIRTQDGKRFDRKVLPDPYRRSPIMNMVSRLTPTGKEIWAVTYSCLSSKNRCLLMYSRDQGKSWSKVIDFDGTRSEVRLVNSSVNPSSRLYISITHYTDQPGTQHAHQLYAIEKS